MSDYKLAAAVFKNANEIKVGVPYSEKSSRKTVTVVSEPMNLLFDDVKNQKMKGGKKEKEKKKRWKKRKKKRKKKSSKIGKRKKDNHGRRQERREGKNETRKKNNGEKLTKHFKGQE